MIPETISPWFGGMACGSPSWWIRRDDAVHGQPHGRRPRQEPRGSSRELGINLSLTFEPYVFAYAGSAQIVVHEDNQVTEFFVITQAIE
jgi:hypothetical protein